MNNLTEKEQQELDKLNSINKEFHYFTKEEYDRLQELRKKKFESEHQIEEGARL